MELSTHVQALVDQKRLIEQLQRPVRDLPISQHRRIDLFNAGYRQVWQLLVVPEEDLLKIRYFGPSALSSLKKYLRGERMHFSMTFPKGDYPWNTLLP
jgi:hypothetical protein